MAEAMLRQLAKEANFGLEVRSAGVAAMKGSSISKHAVTALQDHHIDAAGASSTPLTMREVEWADLILTMTGGHKQHVVQLYPHAVERTYTLKEYVDVDEQVLADLMTLEEKIADWQMRMALGEKIPDADRDEIIALQQRIPNMDISDPYGGSLEEYRRCAEEIHRSLIKLLRRAGD
jgi:protein-tyrosine phosphatase